MNNQKKQPITLAVNGVEKSGLCEGGDMLVDVLRQMGFVSVKKGCDTGSCGVCTVLIDGKPVASCSYLALRAQGKAITTVDGIPEEARALGRFLTAEGAEQCGFCSPGLVLTVYAMRKELKNPGLDDIKHYLSGNLCRCTGYEGQTRAILKYLEAEK